MTLTADAQQAPARTEADGYATPRVVVLVPYREADATRAQLWDYVQRWWADEFPDWPVVAAPGPADGPFCRARAINLAASDADDLYGRWDVAIITDADTVVPTGQVADAMAVADFTGTMTLGYDTYVSLNRRGTRRILDGARYDEANWMRSRELVLKASTYSSLVAVRRDLWDVVGGFDESFEGWGWEDTSFALAAQSVGGQVERVPGPCWHFWHPKSAERSRKPPTYYANRDRHAAYQAAYDAHDQEELLRLARGGAL